MTFHLKMLNQISVSPFEKQSMEHINRTFEASDKVLSNWKPCKVSLGHHRLLIDTLTDVPEIKHPCEIAD